MLCYALLVFSGKQNLKPPGELSRFTCVWLFGTLWAAAHQALLSMGFSRQEYWSGLSWPPEEIIINTNKGVSECRHSPSLHLYHCELVQPLTKQFSHSEKWKMSLTLQSYHQAYTYKHMCMCPSGVALQMSTAALCAISQVLETNPGFINTRRDILTKAYYPAVKNKWITTTRTNCTRWRF